MSKHNCEMMDAVRAKYEFPFVNPIYVDPQTLMLGVADLGVDLYKKTPSGNVSNKGRATVYLNFCPFCGAKLRDVK